MYKDACGNCSGPGKHLNECTAPLHCKGGPVEYMAENNQSTYCCEVSKLNVPILGVYQQEHLESTIFVCVGAIGGFICPMRRLMRRPKVLDSTASL